MNGIISLVNIFGILLSNSLFFIFGLFGKIGYFPFYLVLGYQYYSSSYLWLVFDLMNKWAYFGSILLIYYYSFSLIMNFGDWFVLMNLFIMKITQHKRRSDIKTPKDITPRNFWRKKMKGVYNNRRLRTYSRASSLDKIASKLFPVWSSLIAPLA